MTRVLVIDDEPSILRALRINLTARNYEVSTACDGTTGLAAISRERPDAVILDLGLPDMEGTEVIHGVRGWSTTPIIVLSVWGAEHQKVAALDAGADDYVTKPFGMDELLARLRAAVRRAAPAAPEGGAHRETSASSRGASLQAETLSARVDSRSVASRADWPSVAEAQNSNVSGRNGEIRARYIICPRSLLGRVPAVAF